MATNVPINMDTPITVKVQIQGSNRKFKLPLRDLVPAQFPQKLRFLLSIPNGQDVVFERFSDSAAAYVTLDAGNVQVYKTLMRAAKAKLKLRIRATVAPEHLEEPAIPKESKVEVSISTPEAPKPRPASLALPFEQPSPHRSTPSVQARQSLHELKPTPATTIQPPQTQLHEELKGASGESEATQARTFLARDNIFAESANLSRERDLAFRTKEPSSHSPLYSWSVYCNNCDEPMANEHYHCSICQDGDYDLCSPCVDKGVHCPGERHWLLKRFVQNGKVINSTTEKIAPKPKVEPKTFPSPKPIFEIEPEMPGAFTEDRKAALEVEEPTRTCNACVKVFLDREFVTCVDCEDYDLCLQCHVGEKHGHHPGHTFEAATTESSLSQLAENLCKAGRNIHHNAICDGCDKFIYGVRHKCLNCPDWDYCGKCIKSAKFIHPVHRFVPIYDPLPEPRSAAVRHYGIYCDGPLCKNKENQTYIEGIRYKCAVCHDTDFCAACEAIPINRHNRTHPLIKFKTPVRNVSVTTMGEDKNGVAMTTMGDQFQKKSVSTETLPVSSANAATQVQTIADLKPSEASPARPIKQLNIKDLLAEPVPEQSKAGNSSPDLEESKAPQETASSELNAHFIRDSVADGTKISSGTIFSQTWTLRNPGPYAWPSGCSVRYVGGDNMLNIDDSRPSTAVEISEATESNVIGRKVEVGEEMSFSVCLKAPKKEGIAISYWRLKAADGTPFGHRLWCHIDATTPSLPHEVASKLPVLQVNPQPVPRSASSPSSNPDYALQLRLLEMRNKARLEQARKKQEIPAADSSLTAALAEAEKRHAMVRAETLENMRRAAALINGDLQKLSKLNLSESPESRKELPPMPSFQACAEETEHKLPSPPSVESAPASPAHNSAMIFPKLEKESPVSSTHEAQQYASAPSEAVTHADTETLISPSNNSEIEIFEDAESVELFGESDSDEDGFVTDEEYDILDASDEEAV